MTIEEKAKAYDEALERAKKSLRAANDTGQDIVEYIFPQLAESEDERMINALIQFTKENQYKETVYKGVQISKNTFLSYLEKQKEQKPLNINAASEWLRKHICNYINSEYNEFHKCIEYDGSIDKERLINDFEKAMQKEQKPALIPERIRPKFAVGDTVCRPMWSDHTIREIYIRCNDPVYVCVNEEGTESHISMSEQDEWERKEQKPADYCSVRDEFDLDGNLKQKPAERNYDNRIQYDSVKSGIESFASTYSFNIESKLFTQLTKEQQQLWREEIERAVIAGGESGIELSRDNRYKENRTIEWSEEDEEIFNNIIEKAKGGHWIEINEIAWLIERFKLLRSQPKQEWSEKDKKILQSLHHVMNCADAQNAVKQDGLSVEDVCTFLFSIQPSWKLSEGQQGVELLTKLEKAVFDMLVERTNEITISEKQARKYAPIFLAIMKDEILGEHWKPSEEQMSYLLKAITTLGEEGDCKTAAILNEIRLKLEKH